MSYRPTSAQLQELANKTNELLDPEETQESELLDRNLTQIEIAAKQFVDNNVGPISDTKALRLLSQRSIDTEGHRKAIQLLDLQANPVPLNTYVEDTDIDSHLKLYHDEIILHALHDCMETTAVEFERRVSHQLENDWRRAQQEILSSVGQRGGQDMMLANSGYQQQHHHHTTTNNSLQDLSVSRIHQLENSNPNSPQRFVNTSGTPGSIMRQQQQQQGQGTLYFGGHVRLSNLQVNYHQCIKDLNEKRRPGRAVLCPLLTHFKGASAFENDLDGVQREISWDLLRTMIGEDQHQVDQHQYNGPAQSQYRQQRLSRDPSQQKAYQMNFVNGGIQYLQNQWKRTMEECTGAGGSSYNTNHSESIGLVRKYLQGTDYEGEDRNPWAVAYYCLRCGAYDDAINVFKQVISRSNNYDWSGTNIANEPEHIVSGLEAWRSCFAGSNNNMQTSTDWKAYVKTTFKNKNTSPNASYKSAVLTLLAQMVGEGRAGEGSQHIVHQLEGLAVSENIEDFMWHQLSIVVTSGKMKGNVSRNDSFDNFTMENLSDVIMKVYGPDYFSSDNNHPFHYFTLLLYCLQFERALTYLAVNAGRPDDAVHFAIALDHYGVLKRSGEQGIQNQPRRRGGFGNDSSIGNSINSQTPRNKRINPGVCIDDEGNFALGQMVNDYIERIAGADITVATDYLCVLRKSGDNSGNAGQIERNTFLTKLFFNAHEKQLDQLLGAKDQSSTGYLSKVIQDDAEVQEIIRLAARNAEKKNNLERAIDLYWRARLFDRVLHLVNLQLSQAIVPSDGGFDNNRQPNTLKRARDLAGMIRNGKARNVSDKERDTLYILLQLDQFFVLVHEQKDYAKALELIQQKKVDLLPTNDSEYERQAKRARFNELGEPIVKNFHKVLEDYMLCLLQLQKKAVANGNMIIGGRNDYNRNNNNFQNPESYNEEIKNIGAKAEAIMSFTAWLKHKLPPQTYNKLAEYESEITKGGLGLGASSRR